MSSIHIVILICLIAFAVIYIAHFQKWQYFAPVIGARIVGCHFGRYFLYMIFPAPSSKVYFQK